MSVTGPSTIHARYTSYTALRVVGYVVTIGSIVGGGYLVLTSFHTVTTCTAGVCNDEAEIDKTKLLVGGLVMIGGAIAGSLMSSKSDGAYITVVPGVEGPRVAVGGAGARTSDRAGPFAVVPGLTLAGSF